jgi:hypothetical protein
MILGAINGLLADLLQAGRDVREGADIAVAATRALLAADVPAESARRAGFAPRP